MARDRSRRSRGTPRARTLRRLTQRDVIRAWLEIGFSKQEASEMLADRPKTRGECRDAPRPCPWVSCRHHLYLDVNPKTGSIRIVFPDREPWEIEHSCALDAAEQGGRTLEDVGLMTNVTRERARQIEMSGLQAMQVAGDFEPDDVNAFPHETSEAVRIRRARAAYRERQAK